MSYDLKILDFDAIRKLLEPLAQTPYGKDAIRELAPAPNVAIARTLQTSITKARRLVEQNIQPEDRMLHNIRPALKQSAQKGAMLTPQAIHNILCVVEYVELLKPLVAIAPELLPRSETQPNFSTEFITALTSQLTRPNGVANNATIQYGELLARRTELRTSAQNALRDIVSRQKELAWDKDMPSWQGERLCLALPSHDAGKVAGVRRGALQLKRLELIEPMELISTNNALERVAVEIDTEQQKILRALTERIGSQVTEFEKAIDFITWLDLAFAGARLSVAMNAHAPELVNEPVLELNEVYHPILLIQFSQRKIPHPVPLSLRLRQGASIMVITGPNTGGKTVAIKTVGLIVAMALCGLHVPAESNCKIGGFSDIMVDLGDRQNLYNQLSTFAGHVEVMKQILASSTCNSLILLDELGTGTDPDEGAALANAFIDELISRDCFAVINTHLPGVKRYASEQTAVQIAAMTFDPVELKPNYRLEIGKIGQSYGLAIAQRCGLDSKIVEKAKTYLFSMVNK